MLTSVIKQEWRLRRHSPGRLVLLQEDPSGTDLRPSASSFRLFRSFRASSGFLSVTLASFISRSTHLGDGRGILQGVLLAVGQALLEVLQIAAHALGLLRGLLLDGFLIGLKVLGLADGLQHQLNLHAAVGLGLVLRLQRFPGLAGVLQIVLQAEALISRVISISRIM